MIDRLFLQNIQLFRARPPERAVFRGKVHDGHCLGTGFGGLRIQSLLDLCELLQDGFAVVVNFLLLLVGASLQRFLHLEHLTNLVVDSSLSHGQILFDGSLVSSSVLLHHTPELLADFVRFSDEVEKPLANFLLLDQAERGLEAGRKQGGIPIAFLPDLFAFLPCLGIGLGFVEFGLSFFHGLYDLLETLDAAVEVLPSDLPELVLVAQDHQEEVATQLRANLAPHLELKTQLKDALRVAERVENTLLEEDFLLADLELRRIRGAVHVQEFLCPLGGADGGCAILSVLHVVVAL
mmetsp:Transcript_33870/g.72178  ORF Transcript_33870/g.72178 Transcript_33870/m.72178 type:complete len:294 (-) Transcript_33870:401-1282(-)